MTARESVMRDLGRKLEAIASELKRERSGELEQVRAKTGDNVIGAVGDPSDDSVIRNQGDFQANLANWHAHEIADSRPSAHCKATMSITAMRRIRCQERYENAARDELPSP